jgi:hypothetical protein
MIKYTDLYVTTLARGLCVPGEQFVAAAAGNHQSFWSFKIPWFKHAYLLIATTERLIVVDHRKGLIFDRVDRIDGYRWSDIGALKLGGVFTKSLTVKDGNSRTLVKMVLPGFGPLKNNVPAARQVVATWEQRRALPSAPMFGALPPGAAPQASAPAYS